MSSVLDLVASRQVARQNVNWLEAKKHFDKALTESDSPTARDGLGLALGWLSDSLWHRLVRHRCQCSLISFTSVGVT
jgi:hypothetical protein